MRGVTQEEWPWVLAQALPSYPLRDLGHVLSSLWASTCSRQFPWLVPIILDLDILGVLRVGPGSSIYHTFSRWSLHMWMTPAIAAPWGSGLMNLSNMHLKLSRSQVQL